MIKKNICSILFVACFVLFLPSVSHAESEKTNDGCSNLLECQDLAKKGNVGAQYSLAEMYEEGIGTKENLEKAYAWYMTALAGASHDDKMKADTTIKKYALIRDLSEERQKNAKELSEHYISQYNLNTKTGLTRWGGEFHKTPYLISDFIRIAFSKYIWPEVTPFKSVDHGNVWSYFQSSKEKSLIPFFSWAEEFVIRGSGRPKFDALNKWQSDIRVGFGWPKYDDRKVKKEELSKYNKPIIDHIELILPDIRDATGLNLKVVPLNSETVNNPANVRVVLVDSDFIKASLEPKANKTSKVLPVRSIGDFRSQLSDAVRFTPFSDKKVEGFFVSNKSNEIEYAACVIGNKLHENVIKGLISECLLRVLGLPEMSKTDSSAILGGRVVNEAKVLETVKPTAYDLGMLSLLYCDALRPGMTRYLAINTLFENGTCFKSEIHN